MLSIVAGPRARCKELCKGKGIAGASAVATVRLVEPAPDLITVSTLNVAG
jgi:hypothetical protein